MIRQTYNGKRVFLTGHTGFKGAWLSAWLRECGATIKGYSLDPPSQPSLYPQLDLDKDIESVRGDIRDADRLAASIHDFRPDFVFHLAAQSLVRRSYDEPVETFNVNAMGTVNVLEALRSYDSACSAVMVTSDKCYQNKEWMYGYRENDPLGGIDPYSCSKAMAELATSSYQQAFFSEKRIRVASGRAGNVIGGGDYAVDRIVPDCIRAITADQPISVRNPLSRRPWQHVLEPLHGYLRLAAKLESCDAGNCDGYCSGFNFGPPNESNRTVAELADAMTNHWKGSWKDCSSNNNPHEAKLLSLVADKANHMLGWRNVWNFEETIKETLSWYRRVSEHESAAAVTLEQIHRFEKRID
ncbi:CDP-glucose 4,6-dehydratase [Rubripirellula amarantea]|uniref:CDP-glucose 4,6-dehydratase n=1 Tax=Rubripirellula amarantea TaxID=2527999 RepID=A0A5C5WNW6_9BACT|nr:CDP-glucose 4,6-dehydratase [Rubripirellula amarantea]TWT52516.1 CDP-glucose 4,6-dehydratase [Rubripirellula amarantea]